MKEDLLADAKSFISLEVRRWYADRGIPYRRGYLFHGPPGSGKSSLCHVLASVIEQPIYVLNLSASSMGDAEFLERMSEIPPRSIVLIEDVDAAFVQREATSEDGAKKATISFSALLNAIDGVGASEGRLLCITTNHIDRLDKALIRPGRVDKRFVFSNATKGQARDIFLRWYMPKNVNDAEVERKAVVFASSIPDNRVSVAALQGFLLGCGTDYQKAVADVADWISEQE
jgi:chaperone BCS1